MAGAAQAPAFVDDSVDCAICLTPLADEPTITLSCGHRWHLDCIKQQLQHSHPNPARRLLFTGTRCAKCKVFCDHPALSSLTRHTAALRAEADAILTDLIASHNLSVHPAVASPGGAFHGDPLGYARTHFALYLCSACERPYFGGTVACADAAEEDLPPDDRLCPACTPRTAAVCPHAAHTAFHVWKCRFCCQPATHVCYGSTHMCDACHDEDAGADAARPSAKPCPRPTTACSTPLPAGQERHANGPGPECEQLLYCAWCTSDPLADGIARDDRGSPNFVFNPSGAAGTAGWAQLSHARWKVERSDFPFLENATNFVSSHSWCAMGQAIDLASFVESPGDVFVEVSARYLARTDCPSEFNLRGALLDEHHNVLDAFATDILTAPADYWDRARHIFEPKANARYAVIIVRGKDSRFWSGDFGSKVANACVRVLYDAESTDENVLLPSGTREVTAADVPPETIVRSAAAAHGQARVANANNPWGAANQVQLHDLMQLDDLDEYISDDDSNDGDSDNDVVDNDEDDDHDDSTVWSGDGDETNLLVNGSGARGQVPWVQLGSGSWVSVESAQAGSMVDGPYFRSSHLPSVLAQVCELGRAAVSDAEKLHIHASARFRASTANGGTVRLELEVLDRRLRLLKRVRGLERAAIENRWQEEEVYSEPVAGARFVGFFVSGQGAQTWRGGGGGVLVRGCAIRVRDKGGGDAVDLNLHRPELDVAGLTAAMVSLRGEHINNSGAGSANCAIM